MKVVIMLDSRKVSKAVLAKAMTAEGIGELVTVANVPMVSTGIDYPTSTGLITFTESHLQDLISSQDDPAIHAPRTKIGHSDPRFNGKMVNGQMLDGEPSLATWQNLRLGDNGQTVYGDMVGVPKWLAAIMSTAYPSRSIEGNFDVETVTGHKWSLVVDAVALLGVTGPGVTTLDDLPVLFSAEGPEGVQVTEAKEGEPMSVVRSSKKPTTVQADRPPGLTTATEPNTSCSACQFYDPGEGSGQGICTLNDYNYVVTAEQWCPAFKSGVDNVVSSAPIAAVSDTPWSNFKDSDYTDAQYAAACVYDRAKCSDDWKDKPAKQRYSLRIKEPGGALNSNGVHAAAGRINQVTGGCAAALSAAKAALRSAYSTMGEDPPDSISASTKVPKGKKPPLIIGQVNLDDVRQQYYNGLDNTQNWWWIRALYLDPNELIVDDDEGGLYRVPFTTTKDDGIEFSDPIPVKIQYVDQPVTASGAVIRASLAQSLVQGKEPTTTYTVRIESRPGGTMDLERIQAVRAAFGLTAEQLPDDADDDAVIRVMNEHQPVAAAAPPHAPAGQGAPPPAATSTTVESSGSNGAITSTEEAGRIPASSALNLPDGTIVVDKATWDEVAGQARQGAELAARTRDTERDDFLNNAIKAGKFPPSRREHYLSAWKADPEGTRGLIQSLAPGLVPVEARGTAGTGRNETVEAGHLNANTYDESWLTPAERYRIKNAGQIAAGAQPMPLVIQGGD